MPWVAAKLEEGFVVELERTRDESTDQFVIKSSGSQDAQGSGGRSLAAFRADESPEGGSEPIQELHLKLAGERGGAAAEFAAPGGLEGVAKGMDATPFRGMKDRGSNQGKAMRVFVGVDVSDVDSGALNVLDLSLGFASEVVAMDGVAECRLGEIVDGKAEAMRVAEETTPAL